MANYNDVRWGPVGVVLESYSGTSGSVPDGWLYFGHACLETLRITFWQQDQTGAVSVEKGTLMWFAAR